MAKRISVVVSQGQSHNPAKRQLEEDVVAALLVEQGVDVTVIPHLYDLKPDSTGILALQGMSGDIVLLSWLYARAAHWLLDRNGIRGRLGQSLLKYDDGEEDEAEAEPVEEDKPRVSDERQLPARTIHCLDLRASAKADDFLGEIRRIAQEAKTQVVDLMNWVSGSPAPDQLNRFVSPTNDTALGPSGGNGSANAREVAASEAGNGSPAATRLDGETADRRWYPVIDFSRCTNCMECIDFCLFGVYGIDQSETILVEQPDNCRKGCPACSRVCPENAIIFPQHKSPAIAGAQVAVGGLKIDLSKLFGAPNESALDVAARERDEQLLLAGREAVGLSVGIPKRQLDKAPQPRDEFDALIDELDEADI